MANAQIRMEIADAIDDFRWHQVEMRALLLGPHGAVARDLIHRAIRVEAAAKENATGRPGPEVRTGRLRGSITWRLGYDGATQYSMYADIGTAVEYGRYLEEGTINMPPYPFLRPALEAAR